MSNISKLTTLSAAGAGGSQGFVLQKNDAAATFNPTTTKVCADSSGNIITVSRSTGSVSTWIVYKTDADGVEVWSKKINLTSPGHTPKLLQVAAVTTDSTDAIIIVGELDPSTTAYRNTSYIIKLTSAGVVSWDHQVRMASYGDWFSGVTIDSSDNIYVVGTFADDSNGYVYAGLLRKYNSSGVIQFITRIYLGQSYMYISGVAVDSSQNVYICGDVQNPSDSSRARHLLVKFDSSNGTSLWKKRVDPPSGSQSQTLLGVTIDTNDNIYVNGRTYNNSLGFNGWVAKFNTSGVIQWQQEFNPDQRVTSASSSFYSNMASDSLGNIYLVDALQTDRFYVASFDSSGANRFSTVITDPNSVNTYYGYGCAVTADDELILGGRGFSATDAFTLTIKMPNEGVSGVFGAFEFSETPMTITATTFTTSTATNVAGDSDYSTTAVTPSLAAVTISETLTSL